MKSDRQTYKANSPPIPMYGIPKIGTCKQDVGLAKRAKEPIGSDPPKNHSARLIEYNKWMWHEEKRYSRLLTELKKASWFARHVQHHCIPYSGNSTYDGFIQSDSPKGNPSSGFAEFDVGEFIHRIFDKPPNVKCDVGLMLDKLVSSELETTRLTQDEIRNGCWLTMEQELLQHNKPHLLDSDRCLERTITQQSIAFQYTVSVRRMHISRSTMKDAIETMHSNLSKSLNENRLWLEVGEAYQNFSEYDSTAATNSAGPTASRRIGNLSPGPHWHLSVLPIPWNSVMIESVRLISQRWRGVCSFSQTMRTNQSAEKYQNVYPLCTKKRNRPGD